MIALDAGIGDIGKDEVRQCVGQNGGPVAGNVGVIEKQIDQRRGEEDEARHRVEEMAHGVEVAEPLREGESGSEERIVGAQYLNHTARPANALADVRGEALRRESRGLRNIDVGRIPLMHLHAQSGVRVFRDGLDGDAADLVECFAAQHGAGTAKEGRVPEVVAVLDDSVKKLAFVGNDAELPEIALKGIGRIKVVRSLHHGEPAVTHKPAHGHLKKAARGHVIRVEDRDQRRMDGFEGGVDVARLGVLVVRARAVANAGIAGELLELRPAAVVEEIDVELCGGPIHVESTQRGVTHHVERLVVCGNEHIDVRPFFGIVGQRDGSAAQRPDGLKVAEKKNDKCVGFGAQKTNDEKGVDGSGVTGRVLKEPHHLCDAPISIAEGTEHGQHHERERDEV